MATDIPDNAPDTTDAATSGDASAATASAPSRWSPRPHLKKFFASRHFGLWSSLVVIVMVSVLLGLGTWQVMRLHQKNALINHIAAQLNQPERDLRLFPPADRAAWAALDYRRVVLQGDWLDLHQLKLIPRTYEGDNGYHLLIPLRLQNGQIVLVNRGWAPDKSDVGPQSQNGTAIAAGVVRMAPVEKPFGMMDNNPGKREWAWPDVKAIGNAIGMSDVAPVILYNERARDGASDDYPIGGQVQLAIRNEHKHYAMIWYTLAIALLVIWLAAAKQKKPVETAAVVTTDDA